MQPLPSHEPPLVNPQCACAACVCVCVSVCLSVHSYFGTTGYGVGYERYQRLQNNESVKKKRAIFYSTHDNPVRAAPAQ